MLEANDSAGRDTILPELHRIQHEFGYLPKDELERFSRERKIPLFRIHTVASFFPLFRLTPPPAVTLKVCRDLSCHMAGGGKIIEQLQSLNSDDVKVEGVSCLGRCDRAPSACVSIRKQQPKEEAHTGNGHATNGHAAAHGHDDLESERYYHGHSAQQLEALVKQSLLFAKGQGRAVAPDWDKTIPDPDTGKPRYPAADWQIDPYPEKPLYTALLRAVELRDASLDKAADYLRTQMKWPRRQAEQFRLAAAGRGQVDFALTDEVKAAVLAWQTESDWAKGPELGGWSETLLKELDDAHADLRGLGGAGVPATQKWRDVREAVRNARRRKAEDDRAYIVVNGDESEPGTFKDRELLLHKGHLVAEAVIIAGLITEATHGYIYIRHEYEEQAEACREAIKDAKELGLCGKDAAALGRTFHLSVFVSPGGYVCGEMSALIEAMSDRRSEPRNMPPKLETNGLDDLPTLVSNVETFAWVPYIILKGGENYAKQGQNGWKGRRFFSVSGDVNRPGVYEVPMGMTLRELIEGQNYCRGIKDGKKLKAVAPSGPSGGFLPAKLTAKAGLPRDHTNNKDWKKLTERHGIDPNAQELDVLDLELELNLFRALSPTQGLGAAICIYAEGRDMAENAVNSMEFYRNESCGKCVPCRVGSQKMVALGTNLLAGKVTTDRWNDAVLPVFEDLGMAMEQASICSLGRSVPVPLKTVMKFFPKDLDKHLAGAAGPPAGMPTPTNMDVAGTAGGITEPSVLPPGH